MTTPIVEFSKCLTLLNLSLGGIDVLKFRPQLNQWVAGAEPFLRKFSILRDFKSVLSEFVRNRMEFSEDQGAAASAVLKEALAKMQRDVTITQEQLAYIKDNLLYFRKDSAPAWSRISKNVFTMTGDPDLARLFLDDQPASGADNHATHAGMVKIVRSLTGRVNDPVLTLNEIRDFRTTNPKEIERYSELRKAFVAAYKAALLKFVRSAGKAVVDVRAANKYLDALYCNYIPKGFVGGIDEQGRLYTTAGKQIAGMLIGEVVMNPKYDPAKDNTYVLSLKANRAQRLRTAAFMQGNKAARFDALQDFMGKVDSIRKKWIKDLDSLDSRTRTIAAIVEAIYQTQARIGGDSKNQEGEERYGMSTLLVKQLKPNQRGLEFNYVGKKGTEQHHVLMPTTPSNRKVLAIIKELTKNKRPDDLVFTDRGRAIGAQPVNAYLKTLGVPAKITIHKFRHLAGTKIAMKILDGAPFKKSDMPSQSSVEKWVKEEMKAVGEVLHHRTGSGDNQKVTGMTSINAYIDPKTLATFFTDLGLRVPKWVPKV